MTVSELGAAPCSATRTLAPFLLQRSRSESVTARDGTAVSTVRTVRPSTTYGTLSVATRRAPPSSTVSTLTERAAIAAATSEYGTTGLARGADPAARRMLYAMP